jgi:hypothetical protein
MSLQLALEQAPENPALPTRRVPTVQASILAQVMVGEIGCLWNPWVQAHHWGYRDSNQTDGLWRWRVEHNYALDVLEAEYHARGVSVLREKENAFRLVLPQGLVLAGVPDLVALESEESRTVDDVKTGQSKDSHRIQVMLYMWALPLARKEYEGRTLCGRVVYPGRKVEQIQPSGLDAAFVEKVHYWTSRIGGQQQPRRRPSDHECRFCPISPQVCPARVEWIVGAEGGS